MYLNHYGLKEPPFKLTPHTEFFYDGANRGAILEALIYSIIHGEGIIKVTGEVGSGKTMLCRMLMERLPEHVETIYLANPSLSPDEILYAIADDLDLKMEASRTMLVVRALQELLIEKYAAGKRIVVLIDEAHAMPLESLEEIRLLYNLESSRHKLLQIVLFGQPELDENLSLPNMRQLKDRITQHFTLAPLPRPLINEYLMFRMRQAGYHGPDIFTPSAIRTIASGSQGLTRRINILADKALLAAFVENTHGVEARHVKAAILDSEIKTRRSFFTDKHVLAAGSLAAVAMVLGWQFWPGAMTPAGAVAEKKQENKTALIAPPIQSALVSAETPAAPPATASLSQAQPDSAQPLSAAPGAAHVSLSPAAAPSGPAPANTAGAHPGSEPALQTAAVSPALTLKLDGLANQQATPALLDDVVSEKTRVANSEPYPVINTLGQKLLQGRIKAAKTMLGKHGGENISIQLYTTDNLSPSRMERFLLRADKLVKLSDIYVVPVRINGRTKMRVVYGVYPTQEQASEALARLPAKYKKAFHLELRALSEVRKT